MELRRGQEDLEQWNGLRRGWCWGAETFRQELLAQMEEKMGQEHYGAERHQTAVAKAERIVEEEMKRWGWRSAALFDARIGALTSMVMGVGSTRSRKRRYDNSWSNFGRGVPANGTE
jgi:hypothetical protein